MPPWVSSSSSGGGGGGGALPAPGGGEEPAAARATLLRTMQRAAAQPSGQDAATVLVCLAVWSRSFSFHPPEQALAEMLATMQPHLHR